MSGNSTTRLIVLMSLGYWIRVYKAAIRIVIRVRAVPHLYMRYAVADFALPRYEKATIAFSKKINTPVRSQPSAKGRCHPALIFSLVINTIHLLFLKI